MDPLHSLQALADSWREDCELLARWGATQQAKTLESAAERLETAVREWKLELLTLEEAARETHWAYDTLQRKVGSEIPNAGEKGRPRVRRCDLHPWLDAPEPELHDDPVAELAESTLHAREESA